MRNWLLLIFSVAFLSCAYAIVIVPPVVYFATLSIAAFISNSLIGLFAWLALSGFAGRNFLGKRFSEIASFVFSWLKKSAVAVFSMLLSVLIIRPIELFTILQGAIISAIFCSLILFLSSYSKFRVSDLRQRNALLKSSALFSAIVFLLFAVSSFASIETKLLSSQNGLQQPGFLPDFSSSKTSPQGIAEAPNYSDTESKESSQNKILVPEIWLYPKSNEKCIVKIGNQEFSFEPKYDCYTIAKGLPSRIYCPVKISADEMAFAGKAFLSATGSCKDNAEIYIHNNSFEVDKNADSGS